MYTIDGHASLFVVSHVTSAEVLCCFLQLDWGFLSQKLKGMIIKHPTSAVRCMAMVTEITFGKKLLLHVLPDAYSTIMNFKKTTTLQYKRTNNKTYRFQHATFVNVPQEATENLSSSNRDYYD